MSSYKNIISQDLSEMGISGGGGETTQQAFQNVTQSGVVSVTHDADATSSRIVQVVEFEAGDTGLVNTSLDFDLLDENDFIQEDSVSGTDFVGGKVLLYSTSEGVEIVPTMDPLNMHSSYSLSLDNTRVTHNIGGWNSAVGEVLTGRTGFGYAEFIIQAGAGGIDIMFGIAQVDTWSTDGYFSGKANSVGYSQNIAISIWQDGVAILTGQPAYTWGDTIGIFIDFDSRKVWFSKNGIWLNSGNPSARTGHQGVIGGTGDLGLIVNTSDPSMYVDVNTGQDLFTHTPPTGGENGFSTWSQAASYVTSQPYYITTSDSNQIDLVNIVEINTCSITSTLPVNTSIKCLMSLDDRSTWQKWGGSAWAEHSGGLVNLQTGNTIAELQTGFADLTIASGTETLDFAFDLATTDSGVTPEIDQITVNYDERGGYRTTQLETDYSALYISPTRTDVTKLLDNTRNIKVNIML